MLKLRTESDNSIWIDPREIESIVPMPAKGEHGYAGESRTMIRMRSGAAHAVREETAQVLAEVQ